MRLRTVALIIGLILVQWLPALPSFWLCSSFFIISFVGVFAHKLLIALLAFCSLGFFWGCLYAHIQLSDRLSFDLDGRTLWVSGTVSGQVSVRDQTTQFQLNKAVSRRANLPEKINVYWSNAPKIIGGERWRLALRLKRPSGLVNPSPFDYEAWLLSKGVGAVASVVSGTKLQSSTWLSQRRFQLGETIRSLPFEKSIPQLSALILGDTSYLSSDSWRVLKDTGTVHLMIVSGQHIGLLAGLVYAFFSGLSRIGWWPVSVPWLPCACIFSALTAFSYSLLAGFDIPVQRACFITVAVLFWRLYYRIFDPWLLWLIALAAVLIVNPLAPLRPGIWLSFSASAILLWTMTGRIQSIPWWKIIYSTQIKLMLGLLPIFFAFGLPISFIAPFVNVLAVPWVSLVVIPCAFLGVLFLFAVPWIGLFFLQLSAKSINILFQCLNYLSNNFASWVPPVFSAWHITAMVIASVFLLLPTGLIIRYLGWPIWISVIFNPKESLPEKQASIWILDVGQGLSILVQTQNHTLLYDTGAKTDYLNMAERVVLPVLRSLSVKQLDQMLLSHSDNDHSGGLETILAQIAVKDITSGEPKKHAIKQGISDCSSSKKWIWDKVKFTTWRWSDAKTSNQSSCVLLVEAYGERILLTGDIDKAAENAWSLDHNKQSVDWLIAPHHGSKTSSSIDFLQKTKPRAVIISSGRHNRYKHPHDLVMQRYKKQAIKVYDTAEHGAIHLQLGKFQQAKALRHQKKFWR